MDKLKKRMKKLKQRLGEHDRFYAIQVILFIMLVVLLTSLGYLTLYKGDYYRDISENSRVREIEIIAPRGDIYDKNGEILATNKVVYTASIMKDEFSKLNQQNKNKNLLNLSRVLDLDGADYNGEYPISLNLITYSKKSDYKDEELSPTDKMVKIIKDNGLMTELINKTYEEDTEQGKYQFRIVDRVINSVKKKGVDLPLNAGVDKVEITNTENEFLKNNGYKAGQTPYQFLGEYVKNDESVIRGILNHPLGRQFAYEVISGKNLQDNLVIKEIGLEDDEKYIETKAKLAENYPNITEDTDAKSDFTEIVKNSTLNELLTNVTLDISSENSSIVPAEKAIDLLDSNGIKTNLKVTIDETDKKNPQAVISYEENESDESLTPVEKLKSLLIDNNDLLEKFVTSDDIKYIAQSINTQNNIVPKISVTDWVYSYEKNIQDLYETNKMNAEKDSVEDLYETIIKNTINLDLEKSDIVEYSKYDTNNILVMYNRIANHGDLRYSPLDLTYNISEVTFSKIEETFADDSGIFSDSESIRYYPNGDLAAHAIGYMGSISTQSETDKYIKKYNYSTNALIGKTGIEESQELALKGTNGKKRVLVDNRGNTTEVLGESKAVPGQDVYTSIDANVQKVAETALKETISSLQGDQVYSSDWGDVNLSKSSTGEIYSDATSGAVVVLNTKTNQVVAMANEPDFNPNMFSTGISMSDWESLFPENEKDLLAPRPLLNISMQSAMQPGSTFKLASSLAGLKTGLSSTHTIKCQGFIKKGDKTFGDAIWNLYEKVHGNESVKEAIRDSCNYYFFSLVDGAEGASKDGGSYQLKVDDIAETAKTLGLGEKTGIDINIPTESAGTLPDRKIKLATVKNLYIKFLEENASKYLVDSDISQEKLNEKITEMSSWIDEESLSAAEVVKRLDKLGFDGNAKEDGDKDTFANQIKYQYLQEATWLEGDSLNVVIGQGQNAYTPIQMARYMATIANDGYKNKLSIVDKVVKSSDGSVVYENSVSPERIELDDYNYLKIIREGTKMAAQEDLNKKVLNRLPFEVGIKSGTAQVGTTNPVTGEKYKEHGWMIGFGPYEDPQYVVVAMVTQSGTSANVTPIFRDVMAAAMNKTPTGTTEAVAVESNGE